MNHTSKFNSLQQDFVDASLKAESPVIKIVEDLIEIYPQFSEADSKTLKERITKQKERMPESEKKLEWEARPHYLSAEWRLAYFRALLGETEDVTLKIRLLGEIRKEVNTIDQQNIAEEPQRKEAYERKRRTEIDLNSHDPQKLSDFDTSMRADMRHPSTCLPIKSYEKIAEDRYRRKTDGVVVDTDGTPEKVGERTHMEYVAALKKQGIYICDQKIEAEVIPSPLVLDTDHRDAYDDACKKQWIFKESVLPRKSYDKITIGEFNQQFRRISDGVVVDKLGIPFVAEEKDHHTWLNEQGIYDYDPKVRDKPPSIKTLLAKEETGESKYA